MLSYTHYFFKLIRLIPLLAESGQVVIYYIIFSITIFLILCILLKSLCITCHLGPKSFILNSLRIELQLIYWVLYMPMLEVLIGILKCVNHKHYIDRDLECGSVQHFILGGVGLLFALLLWLLGILLSFFGYVIEPRIHDAFATYDIYIYIYIYVYRRTNMIDTELHLLRSILVCFLMLSEDQLAINIIILIGVLLLSSICCLQYFKFIPFYSDLISIEYGTCIVTTFWVSLNAIIPELISLRGHIIILLFNLPIIYLSVRTLRIRIIEHIIFQPIDDIKEEDELLFKMTTLSSWIARGSEMSYKMMRFVGIIHNHLRTCNKYNCPLHLPNTLYDPSVHKYATDSFEIHLDSIFLKHFIREMYKKCLSRFIGSLELNISYAYFLFDQFSNIYEAYKHLATLYTNAPFLQKFIIYRYK